MEEFEAARVEIVCVDSEDIIVRSPGSDIITPEVPL